MIDFQHFTLANGLQVYLHQDTSTQMCAFNLLYNVGSRDENPEKTGFAHLFEHLMFGGSQNVPDYDIALQNAGGENNAFTSPDITNYYITLPANNIETAFWLESDRMLGLSFDPKVLEVQRKVVIEEFKQRYLNQPYGDVWLKLRPLAYQNHPYRWATIGKDISHIEDATMEDVKAFFYKFYVPQNAILSIAGNISLEETKRLTEKWFGDIPAGERYIRNLPQEPLQTSARTHTTYANVPSDAIYIAFHSPKKTDIDYNASDLLSDVLGRGKSSRLYQRLVKENPLFASLGAYVTGSVDNGLFVVSGTLNENVKMEIAEQEIMKILNEITKNPVSDIELEKVKNKTESTIAFSEVELLNRAMNIAFWANVGNAQGINEEMQAIQKVTKNDILEAANKILLPHKVNILYYKKQNAIL